jgi:CelD/BcsL family acetyltransferase involved in cellulose biosynthesis
LSVSPIIDVDRVAEIDFGVGDHSYKKDWATERRERWGIAAFNPRTARGAKAIVSHVGGRAAKRGAKRVFQVARNLGGRTG